MGGEYDERYILTGFLVCLLLQSLIVYNHRHFDDLYLSLLPQLPLALRKRYSLADKAFNMNIIHFRLYSNQIKHTSARKSRLPVNPFIRV